MTRIAATILFSPNGTCLVEKRSPLSGTIHTMVMAMTRSQYDAFQNGTMIQKALPHLTPTEREFLLTGITPKEWDEAFGKDEY